MVIAATLFALVALALQWWRLQVLTASYDQGIFLQVLWNGLRGHPFESTLSSQLSAAVEQGGLPTLGYHRLGQHFTPALVLWMPLVPLLGMATLPLVQVGLVTAAGIALYRLALLHLDRRLASWIACSFYGANAVIGPTLGNFTDLCQLPLVFFLLMLAIEQRRPRLLLITALLMPLIREDTGVLLVGVAAWLLVRQRQRWPLALALAGWGAGWVLLVTNGLMPLFSDDNSRRFMIENFGQYIPEREQASSLEVLGQALAQPLVLLRELVSPPGQTVRYLLGQGLPLALVPLVALDSWLLMGPPLLGLLLAQGANDPLSINIRYTFLVVPGLFSGAVLWWRRHGGLFQRRRWRQLWAAAIALSLLFTLTSNPNRSLSFVIPDSVQPWVYRSPARQWSHGAAARRVLARIPPQASVAANSPLVPWLAQRPVAIRFPFSTDYQDRDGTRRPVEWIAVDLDWLRHYQRAFRGDRVQLAASIQQLRALLPRYGVQVVDDGVVALQRGRPSQPEALLELKQLLQDAERSLQNDQDAPTTPRQTKAPVPE